MNGYKFLQLINMMHAMVPYEVFEVMMNRPYMFEIMRRTAQMTDEQLEMSRYN